MSSVLDFALVAARCPRPRKVKRYDLAIVRSLSEAALEVAKKHLREPLGQFWLVPFACFFIFFCSLFWLLFC